MPGSGTGGRGGLRVDPDAVGASRESGRPAGHHALGDGEDYELSATIDEGRWNERCAAAGRRARALERIGRVRRGRGLRVVTPEGDLRRWTGAIGGWLHGQ